MLKWLGILLFTLVLSACASTQGTSSKSSVAPSVHRTSAPEDFNVPVVQDRARIRQLTVQEGRHLQSRQGYWVDHSLHSAGQNERVQYLILHYTAGDDERAKDILTHGQVGVHYLVTSQPSDYRHHPVVYQLVDESKRAWHAGVSAWGDRENLNDTSIGIEIVNQGYRATHSGRIYYPYSDSQIRLIIALAKDIVRRYDIPPTHVLGHADIAPGRKVDPGPFFPWQRLYEAGVGAWPDKNTVRYYSQRFDNGHMPDVWELQRGLMAYGYSIEATGRMDDQTRHALVSFQMHFRPSNYSGDYDQETAAILFALIGKYDGPRKALSILDGQ